MPIYLRYNTASQEVPLGYFVDSTDGDTAETALTIANTDIQLWKTGAVALVNKNAGGATHMANGIYYAVFDATDTNTIGPMVVFCHVSGALSVRLECVVLAAQIYDSVIAGTDLLQVDTTQISGTAQTARDIGASVLLSAGTGTGQISLTTGQVTVGTNNDKTGYSLTQAFPTNFADLAISATTGLVDITQTAADKAWVSTSRVLTANTNLNDPTAAAIADAVFDEAMADHLGAGSTGEALSNASSAGDPWSTSIPGAYGAGTAGYIVGNNVDAAISTRSTVTTAQVNAECDTAITDASLATAASITALNDISVADVLTTQMSESYAADGVAPTLAQALFLIQQSIGDFSISGTTLTVRQLDGTTTAATYTLDDATDPTSRTRTT